MTALQELAAVGALLGHDSLSVDPAGRRYAGSCSCGYRTTNRRTAADAAGGLRHHLELVTLAWRTAGSPPLVGKPAKPARQPVGDTPPARTIPAHDPAVA